MSSKNKIILVLGVVIFFALVFWASKVFLEKEKPSKADSSPDNVNIIDKAGHISVNYDFWKRNIDSTPPKVYVYFAINTNDYLHHELSNDAVSRILDLFNEKQAGADIYFTEQILKAYENNHPDLIEKVKNSKASINYQVRQPSPCDPNTPVLQDKDGKCKKFSDLDYNYALNEVKNFEKYELVVDDYLFGQKGYCPHYNEARPGGVEYVKSVFSDTPIFYGSNSTGTAKDVCTAAVKDYGMKGYVAYHSGETERDRPFKESRGLFERPSDFGVQFEKFGAEKDSYSYFLEEMNKLSNYDRPLFAGVLVHDYEFYHRGVWYNDLIKNKDGSVSKDWEKTEAEKNEYWEAYKKLVDSLAANNDVEIITADDLVNMYEKYVASAGKTNEKAENNPIIYATVVSHNETDNERYGAYDTEEGYLQFRNALLKMAVLIKKYNAAYNFQPDWRFLEAALKYEKGDTLKDTNGKNILRYLSEDLGVEINPHSHESEGYNYADVAYLIEKLGVKPKNIVGGFIAYGNDMGGNVDWEKFRNPLTGNKYDYTWDADILWGSGTLNHAGNENPTSGIYRPKSENEFTTNDDKANLINIGTCADMAGAEMLVDNIYNKKTASSKKMYTVSLMFFEYYVWKDGDEALKRYEEELKKMDNYVKNGQVKWAALSEVVETWKNDYDSQPNIYSCSLNNQSSGNNQNTRAISKLCGDGICDQVEKSKGKCPEDCLK